MLQPLSRWFRRSGTDSAGAETIDRASLPRHIAIIMDGNGRWANRRGLPRVAGHRAGMTQVREVIRACDELGIRYLTLYAFSTENWKRPRPEVEYLMRLPEEFFRTEIDELVARRVQVRFIGDVDRLPDHTRRVVDETLRRTAGGDGMVVCFALNYGGRADILEAVRGLMREAAEGRLSPDAVTEAVFDGYLSTAGIPDPDLVIRTSGERRLSNFLLWQSAYAELWFTDVLWPDFGREGLLEALRDYQRRQRRFGGLK